LLIEYAFDMATRLRIPNIFVRSDQLIDRRLIEKCRSTQTVFWLVPSGDAAKETATPKKNRYITIPSSTVGGFGELTIGLTSAVLQHALPVDQTAICLTGIAGSKRLDNLVVVNPLRDIPWFRDHRMSTATKRIASDEGIRLLEIALRFAAEGREGKPIGTIFLLGNPRTLQKYTRPMILNPLSGHPAAARSIHNPEFHETMRELSAIDGAFVINTRGIVQRAGVYLDAPVNRSTKVKDGLGSRHVAAAAISANTNGVTFVISESSGTVSVFADGACILELDGRA
jgi:DNA integrity scanning protein DisA with diadenylate cyclase activity